MVSPSTTLKTVTTWPYSHVGIPGRTGGDTWPSLSYGRSTLGHPPSSGAPTKSTSPVRKHRKVGLDKQCLLMEVRIAPVQHPFAYSALGAAGPAVDVLHEVHKKDSQMG
jgi:hypothetical protein